MFSLGEPEAGENFPNVVIPNVFPGHDGVRIA
jgi:hypothetical protein